jgi:hypothetical protein
MLEDDVVIELEDELLAVAPAVIVTMTVVEATTCVV